LMNRSRKSLLSSWFVVSRSNRACIRRVGGQVICRSAEPQSEEKTFRWHCYTEMLEWPANGAAIGETIVSPSTDRQSPADAKFLGQRSKHTWATDSSNSSGSWPFSFWIFLRAVNMAADLATYTKTSTKTTSSTFEHHPHDLKHIFSAQCVLDQILDSVSTEVSIQEARRPAVIKRRGQTTSICISSPLARL
jgi:hypothetical protein